MKIRELSERDIILVEKLIAGKKLGGDYERALHIVEVLLEKYKRHDNARKFMSTWIKANT